ncbi:hypothetical protein HMPREF3038_03281 [Akkermansia sp. KLE1797]|nr:hypothetical protein HMPREF3038_03281 [Akkermansia sp. KLE1797]
MKLSNIYQQNFSKFFIGRFVLSKFFMESTLWKSVSFFLDLSPLPIKEETRL